MSTAEIQTLAKQNEILSHKVANLEQGISNAQKSLHRIEQGLFGDEEISHAGVIKEIKDLKQLYVDVAARVESMRVTKFNEDSLLNNNKIWLFGIASAIGGIIVWTLNLIIK